MKESVGIAGSGAIACGLAATVAQHGDVLLWARSEESAERARATVGKVCGRMKGEVDPARITVVTELADLADCSVIVEAVTEDHATKVDLLSKLHELAGPDGMLGTTTSSLSVEKLAAEIHEDGSGRFVGLHVFNPVPQMKLVELVFPEAATPEIRDRARALCDVLGKTAIEVPDTPGFVVNRLLFPYLFDAVRFADASGMDAADVDKCMVLGTGQPMGPLALLDFVGLDVSIAIAEEIDVEVPERVRALVADGALGRKTKRGLLSYG